jgi:opacity protein-like surface antigen
VAILFGAVMILIASFAERSRSAKVVAGTVLTVLLSASSAFAQNCGSVAGAGPFAPFLSTAATSGGAAAGAFAGALGNINTAFLTQQGSAFVSAPGDPQPNQPGGGVWVRGVGGEVTNKFSSTSTGALTPNVAAPGIASSVTQSNCPGQVRQDFSGIQVGQDISRLNWNGWNLHIGTTAGYLSSNATSDSGTKIDFNVPFIGEYLVATYGRFFADVMVREEFYSANLNDTSVGLFNQQIGAHGVSVSTSAGYNFALANNWFIEPSAGFIWSRTTVDTFNISGSTTGLVSTFTTNPIESEIGRLSLRVGTTVNSGNIIWQPFGSASVFHEFAGNVTSSASSLPNAAFVGAVPITIVGQNSTTRVGTYGQYSLGLAAQVVNTGWLGFVRVDYRNGDNIEGWTGNAGLRYQFTPEMIASVMPVKVKAPPHPYIAPTNWTGFYAGGFLGVSEGKTDIRFVGDTTNQGNNPRVFGGLGGAEFGYNYEMANRVVLGVEADVGAQNLHGSKTCGTATGKDAAGFQTVNNGFSPAFLTCQNSSNWVATAAARVGYAWERTLFYVKVGGAWSDDNTNVSCIFGPNVGLLGASCINQAGRIVGAFSNSGNRGGWLVGYGTEFDLGKNWSAKAEYDYIDFGSRSALASDGTTTLRDSGAISQVKIGVNYRFTPGVVVAKY